ncbi:MAG TPA: PaaI family thioesterase [Bordetella sp.]|nr:PaaI family thioesterase [Bordetella sp.]
MDTLPCAEPAAQLGDTLPEGFAAIERGGPFFQTLGPAYMRQEASGPIVLAIRIHARHTNMRGAAHGGMLVTLADGALNANLQQHYPPQQALVTVSLGTNFLAPVHVGDWVEAHVRVSRAGRRLCFAECELLVRERVVLRANSVFAAAGASAPA